MVLIMAEETLVVQEKGVDAAAEGEAAAKSTDTQQKKSKAAPRKMASPAKKGPQPVLVKSKRKSAVARASSKKGTGKIRINGFDIATYEPMELRHVMLEPINVSGLTRETARAIDININVRGGGQSSQAQAVRGAIAKSITGSSNSDVVRKEYMRYDRSMLIDDTRRVEPKKFKGPKARARFQKSYR